MVYEAVGQDVDEFEDVGPEEPESQAIAIAEVSVVRSLNTDIVSTPLNKTSTTFCLISRKVAVDQSYE